MSDLISDLDEVTALVQLYIDGANGDTDKLTKAFHPNAWMMGHVGPMDTYMPITDFIGFVAARRAWPDRAIERSSGRSTWPAMPAWPCWPRPTTWAATSSTTSPSPRSTAVG